MPDDVQPDPDFPGDPKDDGPVPPTPDPDRDQDASKPPTKAIMSPDEYVEAITKVDAWILSGQGTDADDLIDLFAAIEEYEDRHSIPLKSMED